MTAKPTPRQAEVLTLIYQRTERDGFVPSVRELGKALGLRSTSTLQFHLTGLAERGFIQRDPRKNRAIQITAEGRAYLGNSLDGAKVADLRPVCSHCKGTGLAY